MQMIMYTVTDMQNLDSPPNDLADLYPYDGECKLEMLQTSMVVLAVVSCTNVA